MALERLLALKDARFSDVGNQLHVRVPGRNPSTTNSKGRGVPLEQPLVLDHFGHAGFERDLALSLSLRVLVEGSPQPVDLVLDRFGMFGELVGVSEILFLLFRILMIGTKVVCNLDKPDT